MRHLAKALAGPAILISLAFELSGCNAAPTAQVSPQVVPAPVVKPALANSATVYVSDGTNNLVDVFNARGVLQYTITSGLNAPAGLDIDAQHHLWVANSGAGDILEFVHRSKTPSRTLQDSNRPNDVALCPDGTAYVADSVNAGGIAVFPPGHAHATRHLYAFYSGQNGIEFYVTCDGAGNVFATGFIGASPFPATTGWLHARQSGYFIFPQDAWSNSGIKATAAGNLLIAFGDGSRGVIREFTEQGTPTGREVLTGPDVWSDIAFNAKQDLVYGADAPRHAAVSRWFPNGQVQRKYTNANLTQPAGVAVDPGN